MSSSRPPPRASAEAAATRGGVDSAAAAHAYPRELSLLVQERWRAWRDELPELASLERLLSTCYQASLLREEDRSVTFRAALAAPDVFAREGGPPTGLHSLVFGEPRPFDPHELRRLAPAAIFQRSLIGVCLKPDQTFAIWGVVHSGPRWLQAVRGGRRIEQSIPPVLTVAVTGPGRVLVSRGTQTMAVLAGGTLTEAATDVFCAPWLVSRFGELHAAQWAQHTRGPDLSSSAVLDPAFGRKLAEHVLRRIVSTIRAARHGGALVFLPAGEASKLVDDGRYVTVKYRFADDEPRRRIFSLAVEIMNQLTTFPARPSRSGPAPVGWADYEASADERLTSLDEALFEAAHLVAMLANVDGAVVLTDQLEIIGFGAEISTALPEVESVDRSLDLEGTLQVREKTDGVGTRHRSSYRLCAHLHDALVIVVSQDGGVRFVRWHGERVTYFDQIATGPWEV